MPFTRRQFLAASGALCLAKPLLADDKKLFSFFAMDTGLRGPDVPKLESKAALLKKLGYTGIGYTFNAQELPRLLELLDQAGLELSAVYPNLALGKRIEPALAQAVKTLKGRPTRIEMPIQGSAPRGGEEGDKQAAELLVEMSDLVADTGPVVSIYPHLGFYTASEDDGLRLVKRVNRKNVGTHWNLYHSPRRRKFDETEKFLAAALPHIFCVTLNGFDGGKVVSLDQGDLDVEDLVKRIHRAGYRGPVGLQGWSVQGPSAEHLARSIKKWQEIVGKLAG